MTKQDILALSSDQENQILQCTNNISIFLDITSTSLSLLPATHFPPFRLQELPYKTDIVVLSIAPTG